MKVTTYSPEPLLKHPLALLRDMVEGIYASRELAWRLAVRNISAMYRQTVLGLLWAFFPPVATTATFALLNQGGVFDLGETRVPLVAYMLISTSLWQLFADCVQAPLKSVAQSMAMLIKINFPREALLLAGILESLFNFAIRCSLIIGTMLWFQLIPPATIWLVPLGLLSLVILGTMLGVLLTPLGVLYKDIEKILPLVIQFFMLLTPVVYAIPESGPAAALAKWNPVAPVLETTRSWLITGSSEYLVPYLYITGGASLLLCFGWVIYRVAMPHLIARLGG